MALNDSFKLQLLLEAKKLIQSSIIFLMKFGNPAIALSAIHGNHNITSNPYTNIDLIINLIDITQNIEHSQ
jgi:hypothetical protein